MASSQKEGTRKKDQKTVQQARWLEAIQQLISSWNGVYQNHGEWQPLFGSDFKIEPSIVDVATDQPRKPILLGNGSEGLKAVGFKLFQFS
jgi:hypothetical protein